MDFAQTLFLESPIRLGILAFILMSAALVIRRRMVFAVDDASDGAGGGVGRAIFNPRAIVPGTFALVALLFAVQYAVVTDRERISLVTNRFIAAVERADRAALADLFSDQYDSEGMDKTAVLEFIETALARVRIYDTRKHRRDITVTGRNAELILAARATVSVGGDVGQLHWGAWRLAWAKEADADGGWRITALQPRLLDGVEFSTLTSVRGVIP